MKRQKYSREYKVAAVKQVLDRGVACTQVAGELGLRPNILSRWVCQSEADPVQVFPGQGQMKADQAEIERLKREIVRLKAERDIVKKAAAYFAKESS